MLQFRIKKLCLNRLQELIKPLGVNSYVFDGIINSEHSFACRRRTYLNVFSLKENLFRVLLYRIHSVLLYYRFYGFQFRTTNDNFWYNITFAITTLKIRHIQIISESSSGRKHNSSAYTTRTAMKYENVMYVDILKCTIAAEMWRNNK